MPRLALPTLLLAATCARGAVDLAELAKNSPFGASSANQTTLPSLDTAGLELRGMYVDQGKTYFSIYNSKTKQSTWVIQGDSPSKASADLGVRAFDPSSGVAVVEAGSHTVQIQLKQATVAKYEAPKEEPAAPTGGPGGFGGPGGLPQPGPDGKIQTPYGSFTPEQIAAFRAEREKRWAERMAQAQQEGAPGADAAPRGERAGADRGSRGGERGGGERGSRGGRGG